MRAHTALGLRLVALLAGGGVAVGIWVAEVQQKDHLR